MIIWLYKTVGTLNRDCRTEPMGHMRHIAVVLILAVFLLSGWGVPVSRGQANETEPGQWQMIALDLMDLEIPGEEGGSEMELPPIQGEERSELEPEPSAPPPEPVEVERSSPEIPEPSRAAQSPAPGLAPFLLEDPAAGEGRSPQSGTDATRDRAQETLPADDFPAELKTVPPPPSRAESLKLSSETGASASGPSEAPEIPLLAQPRY